MNTQLEVYRSSASATLSDAQSLPFIVYDDESIYKEEAEKIFHNEWVFACHELEITDPGDYFAFSLAGEAIVVIRGKDNQLRALSNNCRHRGTQILDNGFGKVERLLVCPYHAWAYDEKGALRGAPFTGNIDIDKSKHSLPQFNLETWMGLVFVNLSDSPKPLLDRFAAIEKFVNIFELSRFDVCGENTPEAWNANWKLAMENAMESYHLFKVHKQTLQPVTPTEQAYYVAGHADWSLTGGKMVDQRSGLEKWLQGKYPEAFEHYLLISLPPSFVGILSYDSLGWVQVLPDGCQNSLIRANAVFEGSMGSIDSQAREFTQAFFAEDKWICERVQKSMMSRQGLGGKLVELERVVVDFHQYLASRLFDCPTDPVFESDHSSVFKSS